jgi:hypothetical protein
MPAPSAGTIIVCTTNRISAIIAPNYPKTAKTLGLEVPAMLLAGADKVDRMKQRCCGA